jgi:hypothetical protein
MQCLAGWLHRRWHQNAYAVECRLRRPGRYIPRVGDFGLPNLGDARPVKSPGPYDVAPVRTGRLREAVCSLRWTYGCWDHAGRAGRNQISTGRQLLLDPFPSLWHDATRSAPAENAYPTVIGDGQPHQLIPPTTSTVRPNPSMVSTVTPGTLATGTPLRSALRFCSG